VAAGAAPARGRLAGARRILVPRVRYLGDIVLTTPLLRAIRLAAPAARITYLADDRYADLLRGHPDVDEVLTLASRARGVRGIAETLAVARALRARRFDVAIDLFANPRTALIVRLSGAPVRVGGDHRGRGRLYTHHPRLPAEPVAATAYHLAHLEALGAPPLPDATPRLPLATAERVRAALGLAALFPRPADPIVGLHPGASWPGKRWTMAGFAALARHVMDAWGAQVLITHGPGEEARAAELLAVTGRRGAILPPGSWRDLAATLSLLDLYAANDCGAMHVGAAVGTRTVGIFGPSDPATWFPYPRGEGHRVAEFALACRPCPATACGHRECLAALPAATVIAAAEDAWRSAPGGARCAGERLALAGGSR
jgi:ADP-heptose:LPS heptosyltransferase